MGCSKKGFKTIATSDNFYPKPSDKKAYEVLCGRNRTDRSGPMHILDEWEWKAAVPWGTQEAIDNTYKVAELCNADLPVAQMIAFHSKKDFARALRRWCSGTGR